MSNNALFDFRNRLLTSSRFRRIAQKLPFFQLVARRRAYQLFRICSGFIHSQVLLACVRLDLFETLKDGARPLSDIAADAELPADCLLPLLRAAAALKLLEQRPGMRYGLGALGAAMADNAALVALVRHHQLLYEDLTDPLALFRRQPPETRMSKLWPYAGRAQPESLDRSAVSAYTELMSASQTMIAEQVLAAFSLRGSATMIDLCGGDGTFAAAVAERWPQLRLTVADLPSVAAIARQRITERGLSGRIRVIGADVVSDSLPGTFDVVSLVRVIHDHDDDRALDFLSAARKLLAPGGRLLIAEPLADAPGSDGLVAAYFDVYLAAMGSGRPRSFRELSALLEQAGFRRVERRRTAVPLLTGVVVARPH